MKRTTAFLTLGVTAAAAVGYLVAAGPIDPPPGPVSDTSPSLADLDAKLDAVLASVNREGLSGPWEVHTIVPNQQSQLNSALIAEGRVLVHAVVSHRVWVNLFDGPGTAANPGLVQSGSLVGFARQRGANGTSGNFGEVPATVEIDVIVENGLQATWVPYSNEGVVQVYYRRLEATP